MIEISEKRCQEIKANWKLCLKVKGTEKRMIYCLGNRVNVGEKGDYNQLFCYVSFVKIPFIMFVLLERGLTSHFNSMNAPLRGY